MEDHVFVEGLISQESQHMPSESSGSTYKDISNLTEPLDLEVETNNPNEGADKHSAVWTTGATLTLLKLYESNLEMVETPKKKTRLWAAISENLKAYNIEMTADQVRWKINALTKKYKQSLDSGQKRFKYFSEMNHIFGLCEDDDHNPMSELLPHRKHLQKYQLSPSFNDFNPVRGNYESKATIELRKIRLANRIEADRSQSKINLEKQWLQYLRRQEEQNQWRDDLFERSLKLRERDLNLRKKAFEMKEALELKSFQLKEREQEEMLQIERDKCDMLKKTIARKESSSFQH